MLPSKINATEIIEISSLISVCLSKFVGGFLKISTCNLLMIPIFNDSYMWVECCKGVGRHSRPGIGDGS